ncbi:GNAT family N-acetyltransferase [uncultured Sphingomonas sp.]|uniref:GNAT family N-acetyltransferase n=1 Tax=uncultured Sphingomonas sp. TaxID=158754 RepID=UPI0035C99811
MTWRLRRAAPADAEALSLVAGATFLETYHALIGMADIVAHVAERCSPATFMRWIDDPEAAVFYAALEATDAPLGFAVVTAPDFPIPLTSHDIELRRIYTLAIAHGQGVGPALLDATRKEARRRGKRRMLLGTHPENKRAQRFYEREGFNLVGRRQFRVGDRVFDDPVYALPL